MAIAWPATLRGAVPVAVVGPAAGWGAVRSRARPSPPAPGPVKTGIRRVARSARSADRCALASRAVEPVPASASRSVLVRWMGVTDTNTAGSVHGGTVMKLCDEVAGLAAVRHSRRRVVTAGMDRMTFLEPVEMGDLVTFSASVNAVWRTSMEVGVRVEAERPASGRVRHTSSAYFTMVALDEHGRPDRGAAARSPRTPSTPGASARRRRAATTGSPSART